MPLSDSMKPPTLARATWPLAAFAALSTLALLSCGKQPHSEADGHDHGAPAAAQSDGHDHAAHADEVRLTAEAIERYGVKTQPAQMWILKPTFVTPARVGFNTEAMAHVGSPLRGRAIDIKVRIGDAVKKGDPLVVIESPELGEAQGEYIQRRMGAQNAAPAVELAKTAWERSKGLYDQSQGISLSEVQRREAEYKAAIANLKAAESVVVAAQNRLQLLGMDQAAVEELARTGHLSPRHTITAPLDGQVVQREVTMGELVSPDREPLLMLADTRTLWVLADVPEARLGEVAVGATVWVVGGSADMTRKYEGKVAFVAPMVDPTTRTAQVRIEVPSAALALKPGMFAQAEIVATSSAADGDPPPTIAVPDEALQTVEGGPAVFVPVPGEPNTFAKRAVTAGKPVGGLVPIYAGLVEGEHFVAAGSFILKAELGKSSAAHEH